MKDIPKHLEKIYEQLKASGRLDEVLRDDGTIRPSPNAVREMEKKHPNRRTDKECAEAWQEAQVQTLLELAEKYQSELH